MTVRYKETGDVQEDIAPLAQSSGLEWMAKIANRDDMDWQAVQEIHDKWSKSDGGLGPGGMLIISIIASAVTAGAASELAALCVGLEVVDGVVITAGAEATQLAMQAALTAAFTSLSAQVATSLGNAAAGGDLGKSLSGIVSVDGLRSLAATMILAGTLSTYGSDFAKMGAPGEIMAKTTVKTLTNTIVGGEDLEQSFRTALGSTFASYAKGEITPEDLNRTVNLIITGATGAAGSAIAGGNPLQGALSAIVAELAEEIKAPDLSDEQKEKHRVHAKISYCSYSDTCTSEEGYEVVPYSMFEAAGITPEQRAALMTDKKTGFYSQIFYNEDDNKFIVAYRGSDDFFGNDGASNADQALGDIGAQYKHLKEQIKVLNRVVATRPGAELTATGQSLGGGLATALAASKYVKEAVVFNPAGVHDNTIKYISGAKTEKELNDAIDRVNENTTAYVSRGDMLTNLQDLLSFILPTTVGKRVIVEGGGIHFMDDMLEAFIAQ